MKRYILLALLLASTARADISSNLAAHWVCDDNAANTTVTATAGPNGTLVGGDNTADIYVGAGNGPGGSLADAGITFDGTNDYFTFDDAAVDITQPITLACWVKTTTTAASKIIGGQLSTSPFNGYAMGVNIAGQTNKMNASGQSSWVASTTSINTGAWFHVAWTKASSGTPSMRLYVNGVEENTASPATIASYTGVRAIGADAGGTQKLAGSVADVRIYSRALSATDIEELVALGVDATYTIPANLSGNLNLHLNGNLQ